MHRRVPGPEKCYICNIMVAPRSRRAARPVRRAPDRSVATQARGVRRREALLEAVLRIVARDGVAAVTHRAVAAEAGVTHRLTTYYFSTKDQMLLEAFRHHAARSLERTERAARRDAAARGAPRGAARGRDRRRDRRRPRRAPPGPGGAAAEYSLVLEIPRQPPSRADYAAWQARIEAVLREHAVALNSDDPEADVRILQAVMRGLQLESLASPGRPRGRAQLRRLVARLLKKL